MHTLLRRLSFMGVNYTELGPGSCRDVSGGKPTAVLLVRTRTLADCVRRCTTRATCSAFEYVATDMAATVSAPFHVPLHAHDMHTPAA